MTKSVQSSVIHKDKQLETTPHTYLQDNGYVVLYTHNRIFYT